MVAHILADLAKREPEHPGRSIALCTDWPGTAFGSFSHDGEACPAVARGSNNVAVVAGSLGWTLAEQEDVLTSLAFSRSQQDKLDPLVRARHTDASPTAPARRVPLAYSRFLNLQVFV